MAELEEYFSGKVVEAKYRTGKEGVQVEYIRLESEAGEDLGWIHYPLSFDSVSALNEYINLEPSFLASDLGEHFLFEVYPG